jgi:hypothetical protein
MKKLGAQPRKYEEVPALRPEETQNSELAKSIKSEGELLPRSQQSSQGVMQNKVTFVAA